MKSDDRPTDTEKKQIKNNTKHKKSSRRLSWPLTMMLTTFILSMTMSFASSEALEGVGYLSGFVVLFFFIAVGIAFDIVGTAATSAQEKPFHAMASKRVNGANQAVWIVRNAEKVSNFCNDVIGDICGIISGTTGAVIVLQFAMDTGANTVLAQLVLTGVVAGITVGGKAYGKTVAISRCNDIIFAVGKLMYTFSGLIRRKKRSPSDKDKQSDNSGQKGAKNSR